MKILLMILLQVTLAGSWTYTLAIINGMSYYTNFKKYQIEDLSSFTDKCRKNDNTQLLEIHDDDSVKAVDDIENKYNGYDFGIVLNLMRVDEDKWFWSNDSHGTSSFNQREIKDFQTGNVPWYAYLDCSRNDISDCFYKRESYTYPKRKFICQYERKCKRDETNKFERNYPNRNSPLCYIRMQLRTTWPSARLQCVKTGGDLAVFKGLDLDEVKRLVGKKGKWWVGVQKARWMWLGTDIEANYTRWQLGEPSPVYRSSRENANRCVVSRHGMWKAVSCRGYYGLVCMKATNTLPNTLSPTLYPPKPPLKTTPKKNTHVNKHLSSPSFTTIIQTTTIRSNNFFKVTLPIIIVMIFLLIIVVIVIAVLFLLRKRRNKNRVTRSNNETIIPKPNPRNFKDENNPTYSQPETDDQQYFKVFNVSGTDTASIQVQKVFLPQKGYLNEAFTSNRKEKVKSVIFDENVVFNPAISVAYTKVNKNRDGKNDEKNEKDTQIDSQRYENLASSSASNSQQYIQPNRTADDQLGSQLTVNNIYNNDDPQVDNYYSEIGPNNNTDDDRLYMNAENDDANNKNINNNVKNNNKNNNDVSNDTDDVNVFYLRTNLII